MSMRFKNEVSNEDAGRFREKIAISIIEKNVTGSFTACSEFYTEHDFAFRNIVPMEDMALIKNIDYMIYNAKGPGNLGTKYAKERDNYESLVRIRKEAIDMIMTGMDNFIPEPTMADVLFECKRHIKDYDDYVLAFDDGDTITRRPINKIDFEKDEFYSSEMNKRVDIFEFDSLGIFGNKTITIRTFRGTPFLTMR